MNQTLFKTQWAVHQGWDDPIEREEDEDEEFHLLDGSDEFIGKDDLGSGVISILNRMYEFRGGLTVEKFLRENEHLGDLLLEAYDEIRWYFPLGTRVALEVVADPEALGDEQLFVLIRTKFPAKVARAHLAELDQGWWLNALPAAQGKMEIALD